MVHFDTSSKASSITPLCGKKPAGGDVFYFLDVHEPQYERRVNCPKCQRQFVALLDTQPDGELSLTWE